jgi:ATP-binding cassette, subfamily B, bacterial
MPVKELSDQQLSLAYEGHQVIKKPPILILDEATSAVDNETEAAIQRSLARITQNLTTIAIAHRLSTIRQADCIYVMEDGRFIEAGIHFGLRTATRWTKLHTWVLPAPWVNGKQSV